jgi:hypothetical protein
VEKSAATFQSRTGIRVERRACERLNRKPVVVHGLVRKSYLVAGAPILRLISILLM